MREGLKLTEVYLIASNLKANLEAGEEEPVAYSLACRAVPGILPAVFKAWKNDIFKLSRGERTALDPLPEKKRGTPPGGMQAVVDGLREEVERVKSEAQTVVDKLREGRDEDAVRIELLDAEIATLKNSSKKIEELGAENERLKAEIEKLSKKTK